MKDMERIRVITITEEQFDDAVKKAIEDMMDSMDKASQEAGDFNPLAMLAITANGFRVASVIKKHLFGEGEEQ